MNLQTNSKMGLTAKGEVNLLGSTNIFLTFSFGNGFHKTVLKILIPIIVLITLCACVLHWVGVV